MILTGAILLSAVVAGAGQVFRQSFVADDTVTDSYFSTDPGEIRLVGVCDPLKPSLKCWGLNAKPSAELEKEVLSEIDVNSTIRRNGPAVIPFQFRRKNRILVFKLPINKPGLFRASISGFYDTDGNQLNQLTYGYDANSSTKLELFNFHAPRNSTKSAIHLSLSIPLRGTVELPPNSVTEASDADKKVSITRTLSLKPQDVRWYQGGRGWVVLFKLEGDSLRSRVHMHVESINAKGQPINEVDLNGMPRPQIIYKPGTPIPPNFGGRRFIYQTDPGVFDPQTGTRAWQTQVNPSAVHHYRITFSTDRSVEFQNIPLDAGPESGSKTS